MNVLLLGGTGRTGGRVLRRLLDRDACVRAVVRSAERLPAGAVGDPGLTVIEADLLSLGRDAITGLVEGCDAVVSCLGHTPDLHGIYGAPRDLVTHAARRVCESIEAGRPERPVRFILMSSVSVHRPNGLDARRGRLDRAALWLLRGGLPPARDNQRAADYLLQRVGPASRSVQWSIVRPDTLREGDVSPYDVHEGLVSSLFRPADTTMANVADFMCRLATDAEAWEQWRGKLPVIVNSSKAAAVQAR